jgi:hypothetical protein
MKGNELKYCYIQDFDKHFRNKALLKDILDGEKILQDAAKTPDEKAYHLAGDISRIARAFTNGNFLAEAYAVPNHETPSTSGELSFNCFALWEGEKDSKLPVPLTFFVYIWPSKEQALAYASQKSSMHYGTIIHSHPILCAFTVVHGVLLQKNFKLVEPGKKQVQYVSSEECKEFVAYFDDLNPRAIHQLYAISQPCISLHAYGLGTSEKVMHCFNTTLQLHSYRESE